MDVSELFPTGNRGSILLTTRNPQCKIHTTVDSCELGQMDVDNAATLLLRAAGTDDIADQAARTQAISVTQLLGFLALAIIQAGAYIRQGYCSIEDYCDVYARHRQKLLKHLPVQASSDYKYSAYTTWEISIEAINKMYGETPQHAIELIQIFCFLHHDGITENIFKQACSNSYERNHFYQDIAHMFYMHSQKGEDWDPILIREATVLLASFSLIKINKTRGCMSMHPLVHLWARDRLSKELQDRYWIITSSTLAASISWKYQLTDFRFRQSLLPHIKSCIRFCRDKPFLSRYLELSRVKMAEGFAVVFAEATELIEKLLEAYLKTLGSEHPDILKAMGNLANSYSDLGRRQEAIELGEKVLEARQKTLGSEHRDSLRAMPR